MDKRRSDVGRNLWARRRGQRHLSAEGGEMRVMTAVRQRRQTRGDVMVAVARAEWPILHRWKIV